MVSTKDRGLSVEQEEKEGDTPAEPPSRQTRVRVINELCVHKDTALQCMRIYILDYNYSFPTFVLTWKLF